MGAPVQRILAWVALACLLPGCALQPPRDGAPAGAPGAADIADAVPVALPRSRYGNPEHYEVFGKRYHVLPSAEGYEQTGIASWYGTKFHGRRTSSGETYDMYAMTAAHKTLPLPSFVEVVNLENGRRAVLKVNDRGPFHGERLIDLSYAAARKLGVYPAGTAEVRVRALAPGEHRQGPAAPPVTAALPPPSVSEYDLPGARAPGQLSLPAEILQTAGAPVLFYLQVGAFSARDNAQRLRDRLNAALGVPGVRISTAPGDVGALYKVQVGPLSDVADADLLVARLAGLGIHEHQVVLD